MAQQPHGQDYYRGVASVPPRDATPDPDAHDGFPPPGTWPAQGDTLADVPQARRPGVDSRGMIVRRRGARLRAGAGWTWTGVTVVLVCWSIWAISVRGVDLVAPILGLGLVLAVGAFLFVLARLLGRVVLEQTLHRERTTAWPSHLTVGVYLTLAGVAFLQQTQWVTESWQWFSVSWQWLGDGWQWLLDLWPF